MLQHKVTSKSVTYKSAVISVIINNVLSLMRLWHFNRFWMKNKRMRKDEEDEEEEEDEERRRG